MQVPLSPKPSQPRVPVFCSDMQSAQLSDSPGSQLLQSALQISASVAPTLADLGSALRRNINPKTGLPYQPYQPSRAKGDLVQLYAAQVKNDEALEAAITKNMEALVHIYDTYCPLVAKGLGNEALERLLFTRIQQEEQAIQGNSRKLHCPIKQFRANYRLAILTEDEEVYKRLMQDFFQQLFTGQATAQRLENLQLLSEPIPRPLTQDFELFRLDLFLNYQKQMSSHKKLEAVEWEAFDDIEGEWLEPIHVEWSEKKAFLEAVLNFCAQCLAYRLPVPGGAQFWGHWGQFNQAYEALAQDPDSFENKSDRSPYSPTQVLIHAFKKAQDNLLDKNPLMSLEGYALALALLRKDLKGIKGMLDILKKSPSGTLPIPAFQARFFLQLVLYSSQEPLEISVLKALVCVYLKLIDQPPNYKNRWQDLQVLGLSLIEAATTHHMPELLDIVQSILEDTQADLAYKRAIRAYIKAQGLYQMEQVDTFNAAELQARGALRKALEEEKKALAEPIKEAALL